MVRGHWRAPELGAITVAAYAGSLLAVRVDLAPKTRQLYSELLRLWIDAPHALPTARGGSPRDHPPGLDGAGSAQRRGDQGLVRRRHPHHRPARGHPAPGRGTEGRPQQTSGARVGDGAGDGGLRHRQTAGRRDRGLEGRRAGTAHRAPGSHARSRAPGRANAPGRARVAQAYRYLKTVLQQAVRDGRIEANPCQIPAAGLIKTPNACPRPPSR